MNLISYLDYYIPENEVSISEFIQQIPHQSVPGAFENIDEYKLFIDQILRLKSIRVEKELKSHEMIGLLLDRMFENQVIKPEEIDVIVFVPEEFNSDRRNLAHYIQYEYKMKNAFVVHILGNHCVNIEVALQYCSGLIQTNENIRNILLISTSKCEKHENRIVGTYGIYGDASGVMLMKRESDGIKMVDIVNICNGQLHDVDLNADHSLIHCRYSVRCLNQIISRNNLNNENINKIIIHNANPLLATQCIKSKGFNENKIFSDNQNKYGHLNQLDYLVNLKDITDNLTNDYTHSILSFGSGWAGSYVSTLMSY